jgi:hypothetical protein
LRQQIANVSEIRIVLVVLLYSICYIIDIYVDPIRNYHLRQKIVIVSEIRFVLVVIVYSSSII